MKPQFRHYDPFAALDPITRPVRQVQPPPPVRAVPSDPAQTLLERRYPALARTISLLWGYPELNEYFQKLWLADGQSEPIDPEAMSDLMVLARLHQDLVPPKPRHTVSNIYGLDYEHLRKPDIWASVPRRR